MEHLHELRFLSRLLEKAHIGWWRADLSREQYTCSPLFINLLGLDKSGIISFSDFNRRMLRTVRNHNKSLPFEQLPKSPEALYLLSTTEGPRWVKSKIGDVVIETDDTQIIYGIAEVLQRPFSITAFDALQQSEHILYNIFQKLPVGIELYNKEGFLIDLNEKEKELFHLKRKEDLLGINIFENPIFPDDMKRKIRNHENADFYFRYNFDKIGEYYQTEKRHGSIDLVTKVTTLYNAEGKPSNIVLIHADRTEEAVANTKVQEFESLFDLVGEYAKVGYAYYNIFTRNGYASRSWYKNVGEEESTPLHAIAGIYHHVHPDDRRYIIDFLQQAERGERQKFNRKVRVLRGNGLSTWTHINLFVRKYAPEEGMIEVVSINYDITQLKNTESKLTKALERAAEADFMKSTFLTNMTHEIRTPLNAIVGFSSMLPSIEDKEEQQEYIRLIDQNNHLLLKMVNDVIELSDIEFGNIGLDPIWLDPADLVAESLNEVAIHVPSELEINVDIDHETWVKLDHTRMKQVLNNLISNALKNTPSGEIYICGKTDVNGLEISVVDTGVGIPEEMKERIFRLFEKVDSFQQGAGLGLPICKAILERMKGSIEMESTVGVGSTFTIKVPCPTKPASDITDEDL